ncbi:glycosyl hydrolase family 76-domain-containing protein [Boeremia exigua]|uniref:glycosyl hydrolase family 76-domain-containing protein n=1 Tax=Boeremia exigua TaxID=749465 RepID=UPI001E8E96AD|nr:glycosyl hydrolase family 76-domain-containing protein [Boeremia exigua]KAH6633332.1 glycosyl hydrolase family 76-domain-containing protein [Boeremia exigua]
MKFFATVGAVLLPFIASTARGIELDPENEASIKAAARTYAYGLMELYKNNATGTPIEEIGIFPQPLYWWTAGASWGGLIEYSQFSGDDSHVKALQQALTSNYGPNNDFIMSYRKSQTGNDDQAFWALAVMSALEYQFPEPESAPADYLEVAVNAFNNIVGRWDTTTCDGGLKWQIYPENSYGYNYKNSISNGCTFALGARLARYTGNQTYADWAEKIYDWTKSVGLISDIYEVFDGVDDKTNCAEVADKTQWTYNNAMFLHGSAFMYDVTNGASVWKDRVSGFLSHAELLFFSPVEKDNIMYEWACETGISGRTCNLDQQSFKAYLSRFMAKTAAVAPFTKDTITKYLTASAVGAAKSCSGGDDKATCGSKWYTGSWDGLSGVGQQLAALEVTQALLSLKQNIVPVKKGAVEPKPTAAPKPSSTPASKPTTAPVSKPAESSKAAEPSPAPSSSQTEPIISSADVPAPPKSTEVAPASSAAPSTENAVQTSAIPNKSTPAAIVPTVIAVPTSAVPTQSTPSVAAPTEKPASQVGEIKTSAASCSTSTTVTITVSRPTAGVNTTCTPSTTITVYVPPVTSAPEVPSVATSSAPVVPPVLTTLMPVAPPANVSVPANGSVPSSTAPVEFQGAASSTKVMGGSFLVAMAVAVVAGLV